MKCKMVCPLIAALLLIPTTTQARQRQATGSRSPRIRTLALVPASIAAETGWTLLADANELTAGDAAALYAKAAQSLPGRLNQQQIRSWLRLPLDELPKAQVQQVLRQAQASLQQVEMGARCRECNWPPFTPGTPPAHLTEYRVLSQLMCLRARLQIAQGQCDDAVGTIRTSLAMARHVGDGPTVIQGLVGVAMATIALQRIEDIAQTDDGPNLHAALQALPRPLVDLEKPIASERNSLASNPQYNALTRVAMQRQMEKSFERVRQLMQRLDRDVAALQSIEALRHYVATHNRQLPARIADLTDPPAPENPSTQKPFGYRLNGAKAILEVATQGGEPRDAIRYEITLAR